MKSRPSLILCMWKYCRLLEYPYRGEASYSTWPLGRFVRTEVIISLYYVQVLKLHHLQQYVEVDESWKRCHTDNQSLLKRCSIAKISCKRKGKNQFPPFSPTVFWSWEFNEGGEKSSFFSSNDVNATQYHYDSSSPYCIQWNQTGFPFFLYMVSVIKKEAVSRKVWVTHKCVMVMVYTLTCGTSIIHVAGFLSSCWHQPYLSRRWHTIKSQNIHTQPDTNWFNTKDSAIGMSANEA